MGVGTRLSGYYTQRSERQKTGRANCR